MKQRYMGIVLMLFLVVSLLAACGGEEDTGDFDEEPTLPPGVPTATPVISSAGDAVAVGDYTITISSSKIEDNLLKVIFKFDNTKNEAAVDVRQRGFTATAPDGSKLDYNIICSELGKEVAAKGILEGPVCWDASSLKGTKGVQLKYDPGKSARKVLTWELP